MFMVFELIRICTERFYLFYEILHFFTNFIIDRLMQIMTLQLFDIYFKNYPLNLNYKERVI